MKKKYSELSEKEKNIFIIIIAISLMLLFLGYNAIEKFIIKRRELKESMKIALVTDHGRYFTAINCVKKYLTVVQEGNKDDILLLINDKYKKENNISELNYKNFIPSLDKSSIYEYDGEEMYQKKISKNITEYYIKGKIKKTIMDEDSVERNYNITIVLYQDHLVFDIIPGIGGLDEEK